MKGDGGDPRWAPPQRHNDSESPNATLQSRADRFWGVAIFQIRSQAGRAFAGTLYLMSRIISVIIQERVSSSAQLKVRQKSHLIFYLEYFPVWITCFYFPQHLTDTHSDWFRGTLIQTLLSDTCGIWWSSNISGRSERSECAVTFIVAVMDCLLMIVRMTRLMVDVSSTRCARRKTMKLRL